MKKSGFFRFLAPLLKSVIKPLGMLGLKAAASATDAAINKKNPWIWKSYSTNNF